MDVIDKRRRFLLYIYVCGAVALETVTVDVGVRLNVVVYMAAAAIVLLMISATLGRNAGMLVLGVPSLFSWYALWAATSSAWSYLGIETLILAAPLVFSALAAVAFARFPVEETVSAVVKVAAWVCVASWIVGVAMPSIGAVVPPGWRLNGIMAHNQRLAILTAVALLLAIVAHQNGYRIFRKQLHEWLVFALLAMTLAATQTRAFTTFAAIAVFYAIARRWNYVHLAIGGLLGLALLLLANAAADDIFGLYEREGTSNETLSGRTTIWANAWRMANDQLLNGYGFGSFYSDLTSRFFVNYTPPHAHNDILNAAFETGAVGAGLLAAFLTFSFVRSFFCRSSYSGPVLLFLLACGITGVVFGGKISTPMVVCLLVLYQEMVAVGVVISKRPGENYSVPRAVSTRSSTYTGATGLPVPPQLIAKVTTGELAPKRFLRPRGHCGSTQRQNRT